MSEPFTCLLEDTNGKGAFTNIWFFLPYLMMPRKHRAVGSRQANQNFLECGGKPALSSDQYSEWMQEHAFKFPAT